MSYRSVVALAVVALVGSCETACGCSPLGPASANVTGTVLGMDGNPVAGATVGALVIDALDCGPAIAYDNGPTTAAGEYALTLFTQTNGPIVICFDVFATTSASTTDTAWSRAHSVTADLAAPTTRIDLSFAP